MTAPIALTCGEPAGVGPELAFKAWETLRHEAPFFLIGDAAHLSGLGDVRPIGSPEQAAGSDALPLLQHDFPAPRQPGRPDPQNAPAVVSAIRRAVALVSAGQASALCTGPVHKKALYEGAGFAFPGHTEFLADLAGASKVVMMLAAPGLRPGLRVVPVTIHIPLSEVPGTLSGTLLRDTISMTARALRERFGIHAPRLAVAGLNPHAGEGGAMGREDQDLIAPVIEALSAEGVAITGPLPADTMFHAEARARYDAAICMYHDQALIPLKTLDFHGGVNITLGLPFIRTSPDHGTALDIAGSGQANPASLIAALRMARDMARA